MIDGRTRMEYPQEESFARIRSSNF
jgi:hypothetical protein